MKMIGIAVVLALVGSSIQGMSTALAFKKLHEKKSPKQVDDPEQLAQIIKNKLIDRAELFRKEFLRFQHLEQSTQQAITRAASDENTLKECSLRGALQSYRRQKKQAEDQFYKDIGLGNTLYLVNSGIEMDPTTRTGEEWFNELVFTDILMLAEGIGFTSKETKKLRQEHFIQIVL